MDLISIGSENSSSEYVTCDETNTSSDFKIPHFLESSFKSNVKINEFAEISAMENVSALRWFFKCVICLRNSNS